LLLALTAMLPLIMNAKPPNMRFSVTPDSACSSARIRWASSSSYAMTAVSARRTTTIARVIVARL
jgi:hypothetical protein